MFRAFHALPPLISSQGQPTGAVKGVINMIRSLIRNNPHSNIAIVFDAKGKTFRSDIYKEYKAHRPPIPDELRTQIAPIHKIITAMGLPLLVVEKVEADDVIGTLTRQAEVAGLPVVIASSDKDFFQLINPNVHLLNPNDKTDTLWQAEQVRAKTGVEPAQIIDWLSLVGDTVDGIPGVRGVGPKTATKLLLEYKTVENLYSNLDAVKPDGLQGRLREATTEVQRNQELVALKEIPEWKINLEELRPGAGDYATLHAQYTRWNFRSLLNELESGRQGELL